MKIEDEPFWPADRTRFWVYVLICTTTTAVLAFGGYAWVLYQQKIKDSESASRQQVAPAAVLLNNNDVSTNAAQPSLSPETNPN